MLLWRCFTTKEASRLRNKVAKIILAERSVETFNTFIGYAVSFKHMLQPCFKVISQNCEKGFTTSLCNSWSMLHFGHFFLILFSWLRNHVQRQQQKNKVRFGSLLRGWVVGGSVGASSFGWFLGDFGWFQLVCCLVVTSISQHTEHLTLYCTHGRTWLSEVIRFFYSK